MTHRKRAVFDLRLCAAYPSFRPAAEEEVRMKPFAREAAPEDVRRGAARSRT